MTWGWWPRPPIVSSVLHACDVRRESTYGLMARPLCACASLEEALVAPSRSTACIVGGCGFGAGTALS